MSAGGRPLAALVLVVSLGVCGGGAARADGPVDALKRALASPSVEARTAALTLAARSAGALSVAQRRQEALLLRKAIGTEPEAAVRGGIVAVLAALKDEAAWTPLVQTTLTERDDAVRRAATRAILVGGVDALAALSRLLREDEDPTFRAEVALLLGRRRRLDAVPALLAALRDPHPRTATAAAEALEAVTGEALGYDAARWDAWWAARVVPPPPARAGDPVTGEPVAPPSPPPPPPPRALVPDVYGLPLPAKDVVFVVDVSGSVGDEGLRSAKAEILAAVERFGSDVRFAVLFFDEEVRAWHPEMVAASPSAKDELARFVRGLGRGKRTDVWTAVHTGLGVVSRRVAAKREAGETFADRVTLVVVSDGHENVRATPGSVIAERLDRLDLSHAVVHAVVVGGADSPLLASLVRRGGGTYRVVP